MMSKDRKAIDKSIENKIKTAIEHTSSGNFEDVLMRCENSGGIIPMEKAKRNNAKKHLALVATFAILLTAVFGLIFLQKPKSVSLVSLDVNPSIMLEVDEDNLVDEAIAINEDGKKVLGNMKLENTDIDVALRAIIGSMLENGYIDELSNSILVSVDNDDSERAADLEKHIISELDKILTDNINSSNIIGQVIYDEDAALTSLAEQYNISKGKAEYINSIIEDNPQLSFEELAPLSINDISLLISENKQVAAPEKVEQKGTASEKAYIGNEKAVSIALSSLGISQNSVRELESELDCEDGHMIYEVEFDYDIYEYEFEIDASSGKIIKTEKDLNDDYDDD